MKFKSVLTLFVGILCAIPSFAQRQQVSEYYSAPTDLPMTGKKTYSYIIGEDGENLKDGAFSIIAKPEAIKLDQGLKTYIIHDNGYYKLNTSFIKGNLNGAFAFSYKISATIKSISGASSTYTSTCNFTGNFIDGLPHGAFNVKYDTDFTFHLNATYKKGVLIGPYSCKWLSGEAKGTLTSNGILNGRWVVRYLSETTTYDFMNGILIMKSNERGSTKPKIAELSRKYAAGQISEEELRKMNVVVVKDSLKLGEYARDVVFGELLDWNEVGGYDFSTPNVKHYKYLREEIVFTEEGFERFCNGLGQPYQRDPIIQKDGATYATVERYSYESMVKGIDRSAPRSIYLQVFLTEEQVQFIENKSHEVRKENMVSIDELDCEDLSRKYGDIGLLGQYTPKILKFIDGEISDLETVQEASVKLYPIFANLFNVHHADSSIIYFRETKWHYTNDGIDPYDFINNHYVYVKNDKLYKTLRVYVAFLSNNYEDFIEKNKTDESAIEKIKEQYIEKVNEKKKKEEMAKEKMKKQYIEKVKKNITARIKPIFEFMKNKSAFSIAYAEETDKYFSPKGLFIDTWHLDFSKKIKPFGKIIEYQITDISGENMDEVECILTVLGKKKKQLRYKVVWKLEEDNNGTKIIANSIDINNATIVSE